MKAAVYIQNFELILPVKNRLVGWFVVIRIFIQECTELIVGLFFSVILAKYALTTKKRYELTLVRC